jgi:hypothetical protein
MILAAGGQPAAILAESQGRDAASVAEQDDWIGSRVGLVQMPQPVVLSPLPVANQRLSALKDRVVISA